MKKRMVALLLGATIVLSSLSGSVAYGSSVGDGTVSGIEGSGELQEEGSVRGTRKPEEGTGDSVEESTEDATGDTELPENTVEDDKGTTEDTGMNEEVTEDIEGSELYPRDDLAEQAEVFEEIYQSIRDANLDLTVRGSNSEENEQCDAAFSNHGISMFNATEYNSVPEIGSKHQVGSLTTDYGAGMWQRTSIDVVDYWDGYEFGWEIVDRWDRGVIGATFPNSPNGGTPMWCLEPGRSFTRTNRLIGNALDFLSQDEITCLGLIDKYVDDNMSERFIKPGGFPNQENGLWSAKYGMKQLAFWTFLESTRPSFPNGPFTNHNGVQKVVHNAPVMFEANAQFEGGGFWFINQAVQYALNNRANYKGYGKVAYNTTIQNQLVGLFMVQEVEKPKADLEVVKTSANSAITNNNGNYSLAGAIYGVYRDQSCTNEVGRITTDSSGKGRLNNLDLGTYYVKELKASPGYGLDTQVHAITLTR